MIIKNKITGYLLITVCCAISLFSCKKFIEVDSPVTSTNTDIVYSTDAIAISAVTGVYAKMSNGFPNGISGISIFPELSADNLKLFGINNQNYLFYYKNDLSPLYIGNSSNLWSQAYQLIYVANAALEGLTASTTLTPAVKQQLLGEASFLRGFFYFYLVNLYGEVPLALSTDYVVNSNLQRSDTATVYTQIITDLKNAENLLVDTYLDSTLLKSTVQRVRPNKAAASALLARTYLYKKEYANAELYASKVISNKTTYDTIPLSDVFIKNSKETIWALQPVVAGENTKEAKFYVLPASGPNASGQPVYLSPSLMNSFESNDQRKVRWTDQVTASSVTYPYSSKYKVITQNAPVTEYNIVLRLAEQYLIRAEARAQLNDIPGAKADINALRKRAGLTETTASTKDDLLTVVLQERRKELFCEWGHRWLDLKRTGQVNAIMEQVTPTKEGGVWKPSAQLYPVPQTERQANPKLSQNPGYQL